MALFGAKKHSPESSQRGLVGVDIGTLGVKIVELVFENNRPRLATYGYGEMTHTQSDLSLLLDPSSVADVIKRVCKEAGVKGKKAVASLPASEVFHTIVNIPMPQSSTEDLRPAIEQQAKKVFPLPLEEMVLDSLILDKEFLEHGEKAQEQTGEKERFLRVFLTGAPKVLIQKYLDVFAKTDLELVSLETEVMSLVRALASHEDGRVMIVDVGGKRSQVIIAEKGIPFLTRGMKGGGEEITKALAKSMGTTEAQAEGVKRDLGLGEQVFPKPLQGALAPIVHEIRYALQMYHDVAQQEHHLVDKVLLTGGSVHLPGFDAYVTSLLQVNTYLGDPWVGIATPPDARPILEEVGPRLCVAIGLAMRMTEKNTL